MAIPGFLETAQLRDSLSQACVPVFSGAGQPRATARPGKENAASRGTLKSGIKATVLRKTGGFQVGKDKCSNKPLQPLKTVVLFSR